MDTYYPHQGAEFPLSLSGACVNMFILFWYNSDQAYKSWSRFPKLCSLLAWGSLQYKLGFHEKMSLIGKFTLVFTIRVIYVSAACFIFNCMYCATLFL